MRVLFDTNVILDFLLDRRPYSAVAARLVARVERSEIEGLLGATTVTTLHYLLAKEEDGDRALDAIRELLALFTVARVDGRVLAFALDLRFSDYEDAVLHEAGRLAEASAIVTRNQDDFQDADLPIYSPQELEASLRAKDEHDA